MSGEFVDGEVAFFEYDPTPLDEQMRAEQERWDRLKLEGGYFCQDGKAIGRILPADENGVAKIVPLPEEGE